MKFPYWFTFGVTKKGNSFPFGEFSSEPYYATVKGDKFWFNEKGETYGWTLEGVGGIKEKLIRGVWKINEVIAQNKPKPRNKPKSPNKEKELTFPAVFCFAKRNNQPFLDVEDTFFKGAYYGLVVNDKCFWVSVEDAKSKESGFTRDEIVDSIKNKVWGFYEKSPNKEEQPNKEFFFAVAPLRDILFGTKEGGLFYDKGNVPYCGLVIGDKSYKYLLEKRETQELIVDRKYVETLIEKGLWKEIDKNTILAETLKTCSPMEISSILEKAGFELDISNERDYGNRYRIKPFIRKTIADASLPKS